MEKFIELLEEVLEKDKGSIQPDHVYRDYPEWDSLGALAVSAMINEEYDLVIPREEFEKLFTVKQLHEYIQNNS